MTIDIYNLKNEKVGQTELPESVFNVRWNPALVKQAIVAQTANRRKPWAHAKTRAEVAGGGRKPWRQKGTGRARHGSIRSPLWIGGGKAHGPGKERDYSQKINKKMRRAALLSLLSRKAAANEIKVFDSLVLEPKAKTAAGVLRPILGMNKNVVKYDILFVKESDVKDLIRAVRNLRKTKVLDAGSLNAYDVANHKNLFIDQKAVKAIAQHYKANEK